MNDSGSSVGAAARFFKVAPDAVLVVHDETDLEAGRLQVRLGGGLAGHNGLRSINVASEDAGLPPSAHRRRPARARRSSSARRLGAVGLHGERGCRGLIARAADAVETLDAEGVERAQATVNRR